MNECLLSHEKKFMMYEKKVYSKYETFVCLRLRQTFSMSRMPKTLCKLILFIPNQFTQHFNRIINKQTYTKTYLNTIIQNVLTSKNIKI